MAGAMPAKALLVGAALAVAILAWLWRAHDPPADAATAPARARTSGPTPPSAPPAATDSVALVEPAPPAVATAGAGEVLDLCGIGRMPVPVGTPADPPPAWQALPTPLGMPAMVAAKEQVMARLAAGNERQRAAALLVQMHEAEDADERAAMVAQLVAIERTAGDPVVSAWALSVCEVGPASACGADPARRWTELEPDNAAAWLALSRRLPAVAEAVDAGLAQSRRHDVHYGALVAELRKAWPEGPAPYLQVPLLLQGLGVDGVLITNLMSGSTRHCQAPAQDSPRAAACQALAETMLQRGDTVLSHRLGTAIGSQLGWPADRLAALNAESRVLFGAGPAVAGERQPYGCDSLDRMRTWIDSVERSGEKATARTALKLPA